MLCLECLVGADVVGTACWGSYNTVLGRRCSR